MKASEVMVNVAVQMRRVDTGASNTFGDRLGAALRGDDPTKGKVAGIGEAAWRDAAAALAASLNQTETAMWLALGVIDSQAAKLASKEESIKRLLAQLGDAEQNVQTLRDELLAMAKASELQAAYTTALEEFAWWTLDAGSDMAVDRAEKALAEKPGQARKAS